MAEKMMTFDEFRRSHEDVLRAQREQLRENDRAGAVLRDAAAAKGWIEWPSAMER